MHSFSVGRQTELITMRHLINFFLVAIGLYLIVAFVSFDLMVLANTTISGRLGFLFLVFVIWLGVVVAIEDNK